MVSTADRVSNEAASLARKPLGARRAAIRELSKRTGLDWS